MSKKSAPIVQKDEGRVLRAFGDEVVIHLDGECTGGAVTMWTGTLPPGGGPPPHYHLNEDETFHVLEGRIAFLSNGEWHEVGPGRGAFMPRGAVHTFKNVGDQPSRMVLTSMPSGIERFFARCAEEFAKSGQADISRIVQIGVEHGIHFLQR